MSWEDGSYGPCFYALMRASAGDTRVWTVEQKAAGLMDVWKILNAQLEGVERVQRTSMLSASGPEVEGPCSVTERMAWAMCP